MEDIEIQAEIFRIMRANQDKPAPAILKMIKEHLPDIEMERIKKAAWELSEL